MCLLLALSIINHDILTLCEHSSVLLCALAVTFCYSGRTPVPSIFSHILSSSIWFSNVCHFPIISNTDSWMIRLCTINMLEQLLHQHFHINFQPAKNEKLMLKIACDFRATMMLMLLAMTM